MQKIFFFLLLIPSVIFAQIPEDALRYGYPTMSGTARNQAIGGAMASLGGDITAAHINPAGIGLYKNSEFVVSPGFLFNSNKYAYGGQNTSSSKSGMGLGTSGFVFGSNNPTYRKATSSAVSITVNQTANYNNTIQYEGVNRQSSWSEKYIEELVRDRANLRRAEQYYILGSSLAFWTFLVDSVADASGNLIGYQSLVPLASDGSVPILQKNQINTKGAAHEISLALANNYKDKFYMGMSLNFPVLSYSKEQTYREEDQSGDPNNDFAYFEYTERAKTKGYGVNAKFGFIFKPISKLRLGFSFHSPTFMGLTDTYSASIEANTENYTIYQQPLSQTTQEVIDRNILESSGNNDKGVYDYTLSTPMRLIGSISVVLNEVKDVKKQRGFITADVEYVNHKGVRYGTNNANDESYYTALNDIIKEDYKGAINLRLGGELKFEKFMVRGGFASIGNPYSDLTGLNAKRTLISGGLGYRYLGMFIDLTYVHAMIKDSHVAYYLTDKSSPIADSKNTRGNVVLTVGFKL